MAYTRIIASSFICSCVILLFVRTAFGQTKNIPGGLTKDETPQIVIIAFQGRLQPGTSKAVGDVYDTSSKAIKNPNGCPIGGTFFVGDTHTDYTYVNEWHEYGLEIAMYSKTITETNEYWRTISSFEMDEEVGGMQQLLKEHGITAYGYRNPSFFAAGDKQFTSLTKHDILYDSTLQIMRRAHTSGGYWPTKMTDVWGHKCQSSVCPTNVYPQLWEVPIVTLVTAGGVAVSTAEASGPTADASSVFEILWNNYRGHRESNRAPFVINLTPSWLMGDTGPARTQGLREFLIKASEEDSAYIISMKQMLDWVMSPTPLASISNFTSWDCPGARKTQGSGGGATHVCTGNGADPKYEGLDNFFDGRKIHFVPVDYKSLTRLQQMHYFYTADLQDNFEPPTSSALQISRQSYLCLYSLVLVVIYAMH